MRTHLSLQGVPNRAGMWVFKLKFLIPSHFGEHPLLCCRNECRDLWQLSFVCLPSPSSSWGVYLASFLPSSYGSSRPLLSRHHSIFYRKFSSVLGKHFLSQNPKDLKNKILKVCAQSLMYIHGNVCFAHTLFRVQCFNLTHIPYLTVIHVVQNYRSLIQGSAT